MNLGTLRGAVFLKVTCSKLSTNMPWSEHKSVPTSSKMSIAIYNDKANHCPKINSEKHI